MKKLIQYRINKKTGELTIQTVGFSGAECLEVTKQIREDLGLTGEIVKTAEFYKKTVTIQPTVKVNG